MKSCASPRNWNMETASSPWKQHHHHGNSIITMMTAKSPWWQHHRHGYSIIIMVTAPSWWLYHRDSRRTSYVPIMKSITESSIGNLELELTYDRLKTVYGQFRHFEILVWMLYKPSPCNQHPDIHCWRLACCGQAYCPPACCGKPYCPLAWRIHARPRRRTEGRTADRRPDVPNDACTAGDSAHTLTDTK